MIENALIAIYDNIKSILVSNNFSVSQYRAIDYGIQFNVSTLGWTGILRIYRNKKDITRIDYSQLKDNKKVSELQHLLENKLSDNNDYSETLMSLGFPIIGTDESGKGDYFGPLVSAGVYVDQDSAKELSSLGVKDSKLLSDGRVLELAPIILSVYDIKVSVIEVSPEKYNDLYEQFQKEKKNLNTLLAWGHAKAIEEILNKVECTRAIADQFADESFILTKLQEKGRKLQLTQVHKAEQHIAVAAASILARARFLTKLKKLSDDIGIELPKGSSQNAVIAAKRILCEKGIDKLREVAKLHFKITNQINN